MALSVPLTWKIWVCPALVRGKKLASGRLHFIHTVVRLVWVLGSEIYGRTFMNFLRSCFSISDRRIWLILSGVNGLGSLSRSQVGNTCVSLNANLTPCLSLASGLSLLWPKSCSSRFAASSSTFLSVGFLLGH